MEICVIGCGYVGLVAAACFAELGHDVISVDNDHSKIQMLRAGQIPIYEAGLSELLGRPRENQIIFSEDLKKSVRSSQVIFIAVGTPQSDTGEADLSYVEAVVHAIASELNEYKLIVEKSTVPVLTNQWIKKVLILNGASERNFDVVSNPEFLREGSAIRDFLYPDRIVVGADTERARSLMRRIYAPLVNGEYYKRADRVVTGNGCISSARYIETSAKSAELIKHASNAFLAMKISFVNAVSSLCEAVGSDVEEVAAGMGTDSRIGSSFLSAGIGYGGSCFPKDIRAFCKIAGLNGCDFEILECVERINDRQRVRFIEKISSALWNLRDKRIGVLGLAFKGGTDDIRESPAIAIVKDLIDKGCILQAFDPAAMARAKEVLPECKKLKYVSSPYEAACDAHALLILTDWGEFRTLDLGKIRKALKYPIVLDGRNLYSSRTMAESGLNYYSVGRAEAPGLLCAEAGVSGV